MARDRKKEIMVDLLTMVCFFAFFIGLVFLFDDPTEGIIVNNVKVKEPLTMEEDKMAFKEGEVLTLRLSTKDTKVSIKDSTAESTQEISKRFIEEILDEVEGSSVAVLLDNSAFTINPSTLDKLDFSESYTVIKK